MPNEKVKELTRRKFLHGAGTSLAGLALAGSVGLLLPGCTKQATPAPVAAPDPVIGVPQWPLSYVKLDPAAAEKKAYDAYMKDG
ncbi:MAG: hypothetical protein KGZ79_07000 [Dethiobacter sp.]|jgi:hypothetical protein|nr:hypothetical protein [Dethiobacter sp.]